MKTGLRSYALSWIASFVLLVKLAKPEWIILKDSITMSISFVDVLEREWVEVDEQETIFQTVQHKKGKRKAAADREIFTLGIPLENPIGDSEFEDRKSIFGFNLTLMKDEDDLKGKAVDPGSLVFRTPGKQAGQWPQRVIKGEEKTINGEWARHLTEREFEQVQEIYHQYIEQDHEQDLAEDHAGSSSTERRVNMWKMALAYHARADFGNAERVFRRVLENTRGNQLDELVTLFRLASVVFFQKRFQEAENLYHELIVRTSMFLGEESKSNRQRGVKFGEEMTEDARIDQLLEQVECAKRYLDGIEILQRMPDRTWEMALQIAFGVNPYQVLDQDGFEDFEIEFGVGPTTSMQDFEARTDSYMKQGKLNEAEQYLQYMMNLYMRVLGSEHADTRAIMHKLATVYEDKRSFYKAECLYKRLVRLSTRACESINPEALVYETHLTKVIFLQRKEEERDIQVDSLIEKVRRLDQAVDCIRAAGKVKTSGSNKVIDILEPFLNRVKVTEDGQPVKPGGSDPNSTEPKRASDQHGANQDALVRLEDELEAERSASSDNAENFANRFRDLSLKYITLYQQTGELGALDGAIRNAENAMNDSSDSEPIAHLGTWLRYKFDRTGVEEHISEASIWAEQAVLGADGHEEGLDKLKSNQAVNTLLHFQATGDIERVKEAIVILEDIVKTNTPSV